MTRSFAVRALLIATTFASSVGVSAIATEGLARAGAPTPLITCSFSGTISFDSGGLPVVGITKNGTVGSSTESEQFFFPNSGVGCAPSAGDLFLTNQGVRCDPKVAGQPASNPSCEPHRWDLNSWSDALGSAPAQKGKRVGGTIAQAITAGVRGAGGWGFELSGVIYATNKNVSTSNIGVGGACGSSEIGYQSVGHVQSPKADQSLTMTVTMCLGAITGSGLNPGDNFYNASVDQIGTVDTATVDPATSSVSIS